MTFIRPAMEKCEIHQRINSFIRYIVPMRKMFSNVFFYDYFFFFFAYLLFISSDEIKAVAIIK